MGDEVGWTAWVYVQGFSKDRVSGEQLKMHPGATSMHCGI